MLIQVEAARQCAISPEDIKTHNNLREAIEELRDATTHVTKPDLKRSLVEKLGKYTKISIASAAQCSTAASSLSMHNTNAAMQHQLDENC